MKINSLVILSALAVTCSCLAEDAFERQAPVTNVIVACIEGGATKVSMGTEGDDRNRLSWSGGDRIRLFNSEGKGNTYVLSDISKGEFTTDETLVEDVCDAFFPAAQASVDNGELTMVLPSATTDKEAGNLCNIPLYGPLSDNTAVFKYMTAVLRVEYSSIPKEAIAIEVVADRKINGTFTAEIGEGMELKTSVAKNDGERKTLVTVADKASEGRFNSTVYVTLPTGAYGKIEVFAVKADNTRELMSVLTGKTVQRAKVYSVTRDLEGRICELFDHEDKYTWKDAGQSGNGTSTSTRWNKDGYITLKTYTAEVGKKQRVDFRCTATPVTLHAGNYPLLAVRMDDVRMTRKDKGVTDYALTLDTSGKDADGNKYSGGLGGTNKNWAKRYDCGDGTHVVVYDFASQQFKGTSNKMPLDKSVQFTTFQFKYADIVTAAEQLDINVHWVQTFRNLKEVEAFIASESMRIETEETGRFNHPCAYVSGSDIERVRNRIKAAAADDPVYVSWRNFCGNRYAQNTYKASPVEILVRGDATNTGVEKENYINACRDAAAAFQLALRYQISGDESYADAAVDILNSWSETCRKVTSNDSNQSLVAGLQGCQFANAAELLRNYPKWYQVDQDRFKNWLRDVWYVRNLDFLENHGGQCDLHYWSNWELANLASVMAIGIYTEDRAMIDYVENKFRNGKGSGAINNMIPYNPVPDPDGKTAWIAQSMESGRDQGHATLVVSLCAELCQMAHNVGLDFWGMENDKVLAMCEYTAKYNLAGGAETMPFTEYRYCMDCACTNHTHGSVHTQISSVGKGTARPCWELIHSHYSNVKGYGTDRLYYTEKFVDQLRYTDGVLTGDGGAGDSRYGNNSGAFDQIGWGTLLFYR